MSTTLAEQLQRLAVPQTNVLKRDKTRPSLLFDPREAAGLTRETVYQIGLDGLEELITKNPIFEQFRNTLFDLTSKNFERSVQTGDVNKKLDEKIRQFLLLLSPYFLLNCSHKTLEWLIVRYHIHEYNREDLLMLIMPYHESNIFVRVIQLMKFKDSNDKWYFLKSLQKSGVHLNKQNLLIRAASDVYFLQFASNFITSIIKEYEKPSLLNVAFNYFCSVFTGALEYSENVNETQISVMLPILLKGLKSDIADYCAASYVITAKLLTKTTLTDKILNSLVEKISEIKVESLRIEAVLLLIVLYQSQKQYVDISEEAATNIVKYDWFLKVVDNLNQQGCLIWPFLNVLVRKCVEIGLHRDQENHRKFVEDLQNTLKFDDDFVGTFLNSFLDGVNKWNNKFADHLQEWLKNTIEIVERQYPEQFDKEIYKILSTEIANKRKICLQKIFKKSMSIKGKFNVFEKLYHPNHEYRLQAIDYLTKNYQLLREREKHLIKTTIIDRLNDDSLIIIKETLVLLKKIAILETDDLKRILVKLCRKCQNDLQNYHEISKLCVLLLCENSKETDWDTFITIIPFLFPKTKLQLNLAKLILKTDFILKNPIQKLRELNCETINNPDKFCGLIVTNLQNNNFTIIKNIVETLKEVPHENRDCFHKFIVMFILSYLLPTKCPIEISSLVVEIFAQYLKNTNFDKSEDDLQVYLELARNDQFSKEAYLVFLKKIIEKTQNIRIDFGKFDFYQINDCTRFYTNLMNLLYNFDYKKFTKDYLNEICGVDSDFQIKIEFLLNLNLCNNQYLDCSNFYQKSIGTIGALLKDNSGDFDKLVEFNEFIVPYLLILLGDKSENIRKRVLNIIEILLKEITVKTNSYCGLLQNLSNYKEEIVLDHEQLPLVLFNILETTKSRNYRYHLFKTINNDELPLYYKAKLFKLLSHFNKTIEIVEDTSRICLTILEDNNLDPIKCLLITQTINHLNSDIANQIKLDSNIWQLLAFILKHDQIKIDNNYLIVTTLNQFDREFMTNLHDDVEKELLDLITEIVTITNNNEILPIANHIFKHIDLDIKLIIEHFIKMRNVQSPKLDPNKLKRRISIVPTVDILDTLEWRKGVTILEFLQDKKKIRNIDMLLPVLFEILKKCLDFDEQIAVEYPKQLLLSLILHCCQKLEDDNRALPDNVFNVELIVQCIRASSNPQTHHHALLVLSHLAKIIPTQVLHHIMAIFTFIGSSILRHDDAYSYQIILKIIDNIIPILIEDDSLETLVRVLRVFVDVLLDVPEHRRLPLYKQLLIKIGIKQNLHIFLLLIFESQVLHGSNRLKDKNDDNRKRLDIAKLFCCEFEPQLVITTNIKLLQFLKQLPDEIKDNETFDNQYNIHFTTSKQFRHYKYVLITFLSNLLSSQEFINCIAKLTDDELCNLEILYKDFIIQILTYLQHISKVAEKNATTPQSQYWKVLLHHSYDILDSINALLTPQMFLLVIKGLMMHNLATVKRRSLELLNSKLQYNQNFFQKCDQDEIFSLIPPLIQIIQVIQQNELDNEQELIVQTALLSMKLLVKLLAIKQPEKFLEIFEFIIDLMKIEQIQNNVLASIILCLSEFCVNLRANSIGYLPNFMPKLLKIFKQQQKLLQQEQEPNLLLLSVITALQKIIDTLPNFMSSYLQKILIELSTFSLNNNEQKWQPILNKIKHIRNKITTTIPSRILLPTINQTYNYLIEKNSYNRIAILMDIFSESLRNLTGQEITNNLQELTKFFLNLFEFRSNQYTDFPTTNYIEQEIVKTFSIFALKLSESTFRPLYQDIYHWTQNNNERLITFYHLSKEIANNLKGLFVLFANQFINNAAQILKNSKIFIDNDDKNLLLLENVLKTLLLVFTYDNQKFVNKERFELLMPVFVDQLENDLGGIDCLKERCQNLLIPCIVQFTVAVADDSLWKRLNYSILLKTKNKSQIIRLLALNCVTEIVMKVGEDFLPLLPETIPFLAELLEDEEEEVEKVCRKSIQMMEKILGEPIQKYF